eukprot:217338-Rhodomonas_salina.2
MVCFDAHDVCCGVGQDATDDDAIAFCVSNFLAMAPTKTVSLAPVGSGCVAFNVGVALLCEGLWDRVKVTHCRWDGGLIRTVCRARANHTAEYDDGGVWLMVVSVVGSTQLPQMDRCSMSGRMMGMLGPIR